MSSGTGFDLNVTEKPWMEDAGRGAFKKAMDAAGQGWHDELTRYPPQRTGIKVTRGEESSTLKLMQGKTKGGKRRAYKRTHALGNTATHKVAFSGMSATLSGKFYGKYVLLGTKYWAGWPGKLDSIKKRIASRYKAALKEAMK